MLRTDDGRWTMDAEHRTMDAGPSTPITSTGGFAIGNLNWERGVLWTVANMSTVGVFHHPKSPGTISGWRLAPLCENEATE